MEVAAVHARHPRAASAGTHTPTPTHLHPPARAQGDSGTDAFRCVEMREGAPWLWQADAYAAAGVAHCLLYGQYMEVERVRCNATGEAGRGGWPGRMGAWADGRLQPRTQSAPR